MRLIELHKIARRCGYGFDSASAELLIAKRLAEGSIGWSELLKFGISDADRTYQHQGPPGPDAIAQMSPEEIIQRLIT